MVRDPERHILRRFRIRVGRSETSSYPHIGVRGGRIRLAEVFGELGFTKGVEVGVREGKYSEVLCETIPNLQLSCVDPWAAYEVTGQEDQDKLRAKAIERLAPYGVRFLQMTSMEAVGSFEDHSLDFVYIDGDHTFDAVMCDIMFWNRKVRVGGVLAGHDFFCCPDISRAVQAYVDSHNVIESWFVLRENNGGTFFWVVK